MSDLRYRYTKYSKDVGWGAIEVPGEKVKCGQLWRVNLSDGNITSWLAQFEKSIKTMENRKSV